MSMFGDFINFIGAIALGKKDSSQAFLEPLTMAERYYRWGEERGDIRDYQKSLEQLDITRDDDAPKPEQLIRKYDIYCNATIGATSLLLNKHKELAASTQASRKEMTAERAQLEQNLAAQKKKVEALKADGSLITAKEEQRHADEMQIRLNALAKNLDGEKIPSEVLEDYDRIGRESDLLLTRLEQASISLESCTSVSPEQVAEIRSRILQQIEKIRAAIEGASPTRLFEDAGDSGATPVPGA